MKTLRKLTFNNFIKRFFLFKYSIHTVTAGSNLLHFFYKQHSFSNLVDKVNSLDIFIYSFIFTFTLYPVHSRVGRILMDPVLKHSIHHSDTTVRHFPPNSWGIVCWVAKLNAALYQSNITNISFSQMRIESTTIAFIFLRLYEDSNTFQKICFHIIK